MAFMEWNAQLTTGIADIDAQHRWLVDTTNELHAKMTGGSVDRTAIGSVLEGLADYTVNHFITEETLFECYQYPQAAAHKAMHDKLTAAVMQELDKFEAGGDVGVEVLDFLKDWLLNHIMKADMEYVPFLRQHGAA